MDFAGREDVEEQQLLADIDHGCCFGEYSETAEIHRDEQVLLGRDGSRCTQIRTRVLNKLVAENRLTFVEQTHPTQPEKRRRVYSLRRG